MYKEYFNEINANWINELISINNKIDIDTIKLISNRDLMNLTQKIINTCVECNFLEISKLCDFFEQLNFVLDEYIQTNIKIIKEFYNVFALSFLSDTIQTFSINFEKQEIYQEILNQKQYAKIIKALHKNGHLTQKQLASKTEMTSQNLANYLAKMRNNDIYISYTNPKFSNKNVYYALSANCKKYLEKDNQKRKFLYRRFDDYLNYEDYELRHEKNRDKIFSEGNNFNYDINSSPIKPINTLLENYYYFCSNIKNKPRYLNYSFDSKMKTIKEEI